MILSDPPVTGVVSSDRPLAWCQRMPSTAVRERHHTVADPRLQPRVVCGVSLIVGVREPVAVQSPPGTGLPGDSVCPRCVVGHHTAGNLGITGQDEAALRVFEPVLPVGAPFDIHSGLGEFA